MEGSGIHTWPDGQKYWGEIDKNKRNGIGFIITANGDQIYGNFT